MKEHPAKIVLAAVMVLMLVIPLIANARSRGDDGVGNPGAFGFDRGGGPMGVPAINSRQGIQDGSIGNPDQTGVVVPNFSGSSSGPGLDNGNRRSRLRDEYKGDDRK